MKMNNDFFCKIYAIKRIETIFSVKFLKKNIFKIIFKIIFQKNIFPVK